MRLPLALLLCVLSAAPAFAEGPATSRPTGLLADRDRRTPKEPDAWPWSSIGRVNVVFGPSRRGACTGTLIAPDRVVTAAHCLIDHVTGRWVEPARAHFVAGVARDRFGAHARVRAIVHAQDLDPATLVRGPTAAAFARDWAVLTLDAPLPLKPVPLRPLEDAAFAAALAQGQTARAGYGADRPFLLSLQTGCAVAPAEGAPGLLAHDCDTMQGDSGSSILLITGEDVAVIGIAVGATSRFTAGVGHRAGVGIGVPARAFAAAP